MSTKRREELVMDDPNNLPLATVDLWEGDRVIRKKTSDYLKNNVVNFRKDEKGAEFVKLFVNEMDYLTSSVLKDNEVALLMRLTKHICYKSCCIVVNGRREDSAPLKQTDILGLSNKSKSNASVALKGLLDNNVLAEVKRDNKSKMYFINPYLFLRGKDIEYMALKIFRPIIK